MEQRINYIKIKILTRVVFLVVFFLTACDGIERERISGNYYLACVDDKKNTSLYFDDNGNEGVIVPWCVFAAGYNEKYIIAKQHPYRLRPFISKGDTVKIEEDHPDKTTINYYIVPVLNSINWRTKNGLIGPLDLEQFEQKRKELGIEKIEFTVVKKDLE